MPRRNIVWILAITCVSLICLHAVGAANRRDEQYEYFEVLVDALHKIEGRYVRKVDREKLLEGALKGMCGSLDPYSSYIPPRELQMFQRTIKSSFSGIGAQINLDDQKRLTVASPVVGTPAYKAGLKTGDWIMAIDGKSTEGLTLDRAVDRLTGEEGSRVKLTVLHEGDQTPVEITIKRAKIHIDSVLGDTRNGDDTWNFMYPGVEPKIGYVRVITFAKDTSPELRAAVQKVRAAGGQGLVIDLRNNSGGLLKAAVDVVDTFVGQGAIVTTQGRRKDDKTVHSATAPGTVKDMPIVVLINRYSASASEIVAAALQDHKRAVLVGTRSWGKGSVQNIIRLADGKSALKLTTASYLRPNGQNIHRFPDSKDEDQWGVKPSPHLEVKLTPEENRAVWENRRQRDVIPATRPTSPQTQPKTTVDRQLQRAIFYLQDVLAHARLGRAA